MPTADLDARARDLAPIVAAGIVAQAVASNAGRDALFLTHYPVTVLPYFVAGAALLSLPAAQVSGRLLARLGPGRLVPWLLGVERRSLPGRVGAPRRPAAPRVGLLYLHGAVLGGIAISAFWSLLNERFDPHSAKPLIARVAGAATFGGLVGGVGAERVAALLSPRRAARRARAGRGGGRGRRRRRWRGARRPGARARPIRRTRRRGRRSGATRYLRDLALVILLAAAVAGAGRLRAQGGGGLSLPEGPAARALLRPLLRRHGPRGVPHPVGPGQDRARPARARRARWGPPGRGGRGRLARFR